MRGKNKIMIVVTGVLERKENILNPNKNVINHSQKYWELQIEPIWRKQHLDPSRWNPKPK